MLIKQLLAFLLLLLRAAIASGCVAGVLPTKSVAPLQPFASLLPVRSGPSPVARDVSLDAYVRQFRTLARLC